MRSLQLHSNIAQRVRSSCDGLPKHELLDSCVYEQTHDSIVCLPHICGSQADCSDHQRRQTYRSLVEKHCPFQVNLNEREYHRARIIYAASTCPIPSSLVLPSLLSSCLLLPCPWYWLCSQVPLLPPLHDWLDYLLHTPGLAPPLLPSPVSATLAHHQFWTRVLVQLARRALRTRSVS